VADTLGPVVTLVGQDSLDVEAVTGSFTDEGAQADDAYDGLSPAVANAADIRAIHGAVRDGTVGTYPVHYTATDKHGNAGNTVVRHVHVVDTSVPIITLKGQSPLVVPAMPASANPPPYQDAGATAYDIVDK